MFAPTGMRQIASFGITIDGEARLVTVDAGATLLELVREPLGLSPSEAGCADRRCGACAVLVDGTEVYACLSLAVMHEGRSISALAAMPDA